MEGRPRAAFYLPAINAALPRRQVPNLVLAFLQEQQIQRFGDQRLIGSVFLGGDHAQLAQHVWREVSADHDGAVAVSAG